MPSAFSIAAIRLGERRLGDVRKSTSIVRSWPPASSMTSRPVTRSIRTMPVSCP